MSDLRSPDRLDELLTQLAPEVDIDSAQRLFERARIRSSAVRRLGVAGVAVGLAAVLVSAVVVNSSDTTVSTSDPGVPSSTTVAPADEQVRNAFVLPEAGEARSVLLDDGTPVWIVNHGDGTATAVVALYRGSMFEPPFDEQLFSPVLWDPDGAFMVPAISRRDPDRALTWDAWGRSITADADLAGLSATVENGRAVVERTEAGDVPGLAQDVAWTDHGSARTPLLPELAPLGELSPGWHQIDADLVVGIDGTARLCEPVPDDQPVLGTGRSYCPPEAPEVLALDLGSYEEFRMFAPLVVRVDHQRRIDGVYPVGGMGGALGPSDVEPG